MRSKLKLYILCFIPIAILIASFFIEEDINMKGRFIPPLGSLHKLELLNKDKVYIQDLSRNEKKFIKKIFRKKASGFINSKTKKEQSDIINSLIMKDVIKIELTSFHLLGTDNLGRDLLNMLILATWNNLSLAMIAVLFSIIMGTIIGILQGYVLNRDTAWYYKKIRFVFEFIINSITSIPMLVWLLIIVLFNEIILNIQEDYWKTACTFGLMGIVYYSSILSQAIEEHILSIKELEFLAASELMGLSKFKIIYYHIIKTNLGGVIFNQFIMILIQTIMLEITISFSYIGFGLSHVVTYGTLVNQMFQNPQTMNTIIPIIFAGILCGILNLAISTSKQMKA